MRKNLTACDNLSSAKQNKFSAFFLLNTARKSALALVIGLIIVVIAGLACGRGLPAQQGIRNFGQINEELFRGAQPDEAGIVSLKHLGVKTILNLRLADDAWKKEAALAQVHGILYTNVPLKGTGRPTQDQIATALAIIKNSPGPVFVHCRYGCDRTGTLIACYRIQHDGWSRLAALDEARRYGLSWFERGMRSYVLGFGPETKSTEFNPKLAKAAVQN